MTIKGVSILLTAALLVGGCASDDSTTDTTEVADGSANAAGTSAPPTTATDAVSERDVSDVAGPADAEGEVDQTPPQALNGLVLAGDRIFATAGKDGEVLSIDPVDGRIAARFGSGDDLGWPDDVDVQSDGSLLVTGTDSGIVSQIGVDGAVSQVADVGVGINPILVISDEEVLVGKALKGDGLVRINPATGDIDQIAITLGWVNSFDMGPDGSLIGPRMGLDGKTPAVVSIDLATGESTDLVTTEGLLTALEVDGSTAYVLNAVPPALYETDLAADTPTLEKVVDLPFAPDNLEIDGDGSIWVTAFDQPTLAHIVDGVVTQVPVGS